MRDLAATETQSPCEQVDTARLEPAGFWESFTSCQEPFELAVIESVLMGVAGGQLATMAIGPLVSLEP